MIKTVLGWRRQFAAWGAAQRAQDQRDDENGSETEQRCHESARCYRRHPKRPSFDYVATYLVGLLRSVQEWWFQSALASTTRAIGPTLLGTRPKLRARADWLPPISTIKSITVIV